MPLRHSLGNSRYVAEIASIQRYSLRTTLSAAASEPSEAMRHNFPTLSAFFTILSLWHLTAASVSYNRPAVLNPNLLSRLQSGLSVGNAVIPGGSAFFYMEDPANNLFKISTLSVTPRRCYM